MSKTQAAQINAHLMLTSAYFWIARKDYAAAEVILAARGDVAKDMDSTTLIAAYNLSCERDYFARAA